MNARKVQTVLYLYHKLQAKGFSREEILKELEISSVTFHRYISEIRAFLVNYNIPLSLDFIKEKNIYSLNPINYDE